MNKNGFRLIELLVVVAIIGIFVSKKNWLLIKQKGFNFND